MKKPNRLWLTLAILAAASLGVGCGSDGGGGSTPQAVSKGVITALGSVFVNGIEFDVTGAAITMDNHPGVQGSLSVGMVVTMKGRWDDATKTGKASSVDFRDDLQGPITAIDTVTGTLMVLGQTVRTDQNTRFEHTTGLAGANPLAVGDLVEVSGLPDGTGAIRATHVERKTAGEDVEIKGTVKGTPGAASFILTTPMNPALEYTVLFTGTLPAGIGSGSFVEVKVNSFDAGTMTITASEVQLEDETSFNEGGKAEIEGFVSSYISNAQFQVNGVPVDASGVAALTGMMNGIRVEVEGTYVNGTLVAHKVSLHGMAEGTITAKGSVFVNGIEYDVTGATITKDGNSAVESSLAVGMVVQVRGNSDKHTGKGMASEIIYADDLQGAIETIDPVARTLVVMGMTVQTDATTLYEGATGLAGLAPGDIVEVSGNTNPLTGAVLATYIEKKGASDEVEIKGTVMNLDSVAKTFDLWISDASPLYAVNYSGIASTDIPVDLANGAYVEVKASAFDPLTTALTAARIHVEDHMEPCDGEHAEVKGIISAYAASIQTFMVEGVAVDVSALNPPGLMNGMEVEVEGPVVNGILMATEISVEQEASVEVEGNLEAVDPALGTLTVLGTAFQVDVSTILNDARSTAAGGLSLADLAVGDHLQVAAYPGTSPYRAALVERKDASAQAMMQGPVSAYSNTAPLSVTLLERTIPLTGTLFFDAAGTTLDAPSFFAALATPTTVISLSWDVFVDLATPPNEAELHAP